MDFKQLIQKNTLACLAGGFVLGIAVCGFSAAMMSFSGSPEFCGTCHAMKTEAWTFAESTHSKLECTDCHLPHDNMAIYLMEKGRTGMVDTYHEVMRDYPAHIKLSADAKKTVNANCLRCHENTMKNVHAQVGVDLDTGADCMKCHQESAETLTKRVKTTGDNTFRLQRIAGQTVAKAHTAIAQVNAVVKGSL